jgi:integrase/recombinase XerD
MTNSPNDESLSLPILHASSAFPENLTFQKAKEFKEDYVWQTLGSVTLGRALTEWINSVANLRTKTAYTHAMKEICKLGLLDPQFNLQQFSLLNTNLVVDEIKKNASRTWSEPTRQQRAAAFISFTSYLNRRTEGMIKKAEPMKEGESRTFFRIRQHVKTNAFRSRAEWMAFFEELEKINPRDCLIAKVMLQGGKRISEVLGLTTEMIDYERGEITFKQAKKQAMLMETVISFRHEILNELKQLIGERSGIVFVTHNNKPIHPRQIQRNFLKAGRSAGISFRVSPHVMRATTVTYLKMNGFSDSDIMKVTGHADSEMIRMYDKSALADNASKKINLI